MKRVLCLIPARYASSRFPGKPLADIGGRPMIQRVAEQVLKFSPDTYVVTDDARIATAVENFGCNVVTTVEPHESGTDRCSEALRILENRFGKVFDVVLNIQGDEPFIEPEQIALLASAFDDDSTEIATLVKPIDNKEELFNPNKPKVVVAQDNSALYFSRSPIPYLRGVDENEWHTKHKFYGHIGLYGFRADVLPKVAKLERGTLEKCESLEQLRWLENGISIRVIETHLESISIDTPEDIEELKKRGLI